MMKTTFWATLVALCTLCLAGCTDDSQQPDMQSEPRLASRALMTMQADAIEIQPRAGYTENDDVMKFSWNENDAISVYVDGVPENGNCQLTTTQEGKSAPFTGTVTHWDGMKNIYAVYPYATADYTITNADNPEIATVSLTLANPQEYTTGGPVTNSFLVGAGTATASGKNITASASMKQVMSFIKLDITNAPGKVTQVELACTGASDNQVFPTAATVKLSSGEATNPSNTTDKLTMNVTDNTDNTTKKEIYFALLPTNLDGKDLQIKITFDNKAEKIIEKTGLNFERNVHYVLAVDASDNTIWDGTYPKNEEDAKELLKEFSGGDSSDAKEHVFHISTAKQLAALNVLNNTNLPNSSSKYFDATYLLIADINLNNHSWTPIGVTPPLVGSQYFTGTFDGQGHLISGINVSGDISYVGLFAYIKGVVKNLMVKGDIFSSKNNSEGGGIAGMNSGTIAFCNFEGSVSAKGYAGGICGRLNTRCKITSCFAYSNIFEATKRGGIVGEYLAGGPYDTPNVLSSTWYYNSGALSGKGIQACYSGWTSGEDDSNASFADESGLENRLSAMNSGTSYGYQWEQSGTLLKLVPKK